MVDVYKKPKKAAKAIADYFTQYPDRWLKGKLSEDKNGIEVYSIDQNACAFCSLGAIEAFTGEDTCKGESHTAHSLKSAVMSAISEPRIVDWNDAPDRTVEDVIKAFRDAEKRL